MARTRADTASVSARKMRYLAAICRCWATLSAMRRRASILCSSEVARKVTRGGISSCSCCCCCWVGPAAAAAVVGVAVGDWRDSLLEEQRDTFSWLGLEVIVKTGRRESGVFVVDAEFDIEERSSREDEIWRFARRDERKAG